MASPDMLSDSDVLNFIDIQINTAGYGALRQYLLENKPFAIVETAIEGTLSHVLAEHLQQDSDDAPQTDTTAYMKQLKADLLNKSYTIFTKQLEEKLQKNRRLAINVAERQALIQILTLMKTQQEMAAQERSLIRSLVDANEKLSALELSSAKHKADLEQLQNTIAELLQAQPNPERDERINSLNRQVFLVELPLEVSLIAVLVVITLVPAMGPVFLPIMAGILALAIVGGIMSLKNKLTELWGLQKTRDQNIASLKGQTNDLDTLNERTIPGLNSQIEASKLKITALENGLKALEKDMAQLQQQILAITPLNEPAPVYSVVSPVATAPVLDSSVPLAKPANPVYTPVFFSVPAAPDSEPLTPPPEYDFDGEAGDQPGAPGGFPAASAPAL